MNRYMLDNLGKDWIWEGTCEEEVTLKYVNDVGYDSVEEYEKYYGMPEWEKIE